MASSPLVDVLAVTIVHHPLDARITCRQARALVEAGHEVRLAAPWRAYDADPPAGIIPIDLPRAQGRDRLSALRHARGFLDEHARGVGAVIVHDPELIPAAVASAADRAVWDVHEDTAASLDDKPWLPAAVRPMTRAAVRRLERMAEQRLRLILAEYAYQQRFARPHPVFPNVPRVPPHPTPPTEPRAVYVGRLSADRGAKLLLETASLLQGVVDFELIGEADGDVRGEIEQAHRDGLVTWTGYLPNDEALARIAGAAVGLSLLSDTPNYRQSLPTKVLEYLAHGVPVVTTPNRQAAEIVRGVDGDAGLVVPYDDAAAAARAITWLLADEQRRIEMSVLGHAKVSEHYDWNEHGKRFVELIEDIPAGGRRWPG